MLDQDWLFLLVEYKGSQCAPFSFGKIMRILYHYTSLKKALAILTQNKFKLGPVLGTKAEKELNKDYPFYLSLTRSKTGSYHQNPGKTGVMFVLDGKLLSSTYKIQPVDYWGPEFRKIDPSKNEAEDRLFSEKPTLPNATAYIKEIHALFRNTSYVTLEKSDVLTMRRLQLLAKKNRIPIFVYDDEKAWVLQNKLRAIKLPVVSVVIKDKPYFRRSDSWEHHSKLCLRLFYAKSAEKFTPEMRKELYSIRYYTRDIVSQLEIEIHNSKAQVDMNFRHITRLVLLLAKNKWSVTDFVEQIKRKWEIK